RLCRSETGNPFAINSGFVQNSAVDTPLSFVTLAAQFSRTPPKKKKLSSILDFMAKASTAKKHVYLFGNKKADGNGSMKPLLGGKGANLAEMTRIGLPVPPGFTITTEVCTYFYANKRTSPKDLRAQIEKGVANMEQILGKKFGDLQKPLLVAVRSGARD